MIWVLARHEDGSGSLHMDGRYLVDTLENPAKLIPTGVYKLKMTTSGRVQRKELWSPVGDRLPEVVAVPGRTGIRIHAGNEISDSQGCILVGDKVGPHPKLTWSRDSLVIVCRNLELYNEVTLVVVKCGGS